MAGKNKPNEFSITRVYHAPVKTVWDAWTDPKQVAQWWGPRGFTLTTHSKELAPGGVWHYTMHGPDGTDYPNKAKYLEVEKYARMVYDHGGFDERKPLFRVTVTFSENRGKTTMEMTFACPSAEAAGETKKFIKKASGESTWDRLAEYLDKETLNKECFVINRSFEAPVSTVYTMWTEPQHFAKWLGPAGSEMTFLKADIRTGGALHYEMSSPGGKMFGRADYLEVSPQNRIVYAQQFCDEHGKVSRHPLSPTWPETMLTKVELTEEGPDRTRVTLTWEPQGTVSREELETFVNARAGMTGGWTGSFDKLEGLLATA